MLVKLAPVTKTGVCGLPKQHTDASRSLIFRHYLHIMAETLLAFKAGRAFRREGTNTVDPSPTKGAVILTNGEDGLLHFTWKNRTTGEVEEVCIHP